MKRIPPLSTLVLAAFLAMPACGGPRDGSDASEPDAAACNGGKSDDPNCISDGGFDAGYDAGTPDSGSDAGEDGGQTEVRAILKYSLVNNNPSDADYVYDPRQITVARNKYIFLNFCESLINGDVAGYNLSDETGRNVNHLRTDCRDMTINFSTSGVYHPTIQPITATLEPIGERDSLEVNVQ